MEWGFCNELTASDLLDKSNRLQAEDFAEAVLAAEGMAPEYEVKWRRAIARRFIDRYGQSVAQESCSYGRK